MRAYLDLPLTEQAILTLAAMVLVSAFALLAQPRVVATIRVFAWQGVLLAATTALVAWDSGRSHLYLSAALTLALKGLLIPWLLVRQARALGILRDFDIVVRPGLILLAAGALVVFCYNAALPIERFSDSVTRDTIGLSLAIVLLGMLMLVTRRKAVTQVVGFMAVENGLFFAAVSATQGMPMVVELGIAFDVLVAAVLFGVIFLHIRDSIDSLDVDQLSRLTEATE
ncbi:formate hydrogenlyase [Inmirania thermothiophila]|uniref:Hydrogenase-4 component E n=1 Tax=Inmirania thermothiophila TaxID=1750597 RepID=A0A3N1XSB6_9GAMM|nr:formate hydrogenlyase [Inmirania thermothiophila]ROR29553.1 hydrogenase-4 component E [Inmirania thermothiophila]